MFSDIRQFISLGYQCAPHYCAQWQGDAPTVDHVDGSMLMPPGGGENGLAPTIDHVAAHA